MALKPLRPAGLSISLKPSPRPTKPLGNPRRRQGRVADSKQMPEYPPVRRGRNPAIMHELSSAAISRESF